MQLGGTLVIIGFSYKKFNVERKGIPTGKINISNNIVIQNVEEKQLSLGGKERQEGLIFTFEFTSNYEPNIGSIALTGEIVYMEDPKVVKEISKNWKKDKKLPPDIMKGIMNNILTRCIVQALILSQDVNLPSPIPLPQLSEQTK